MLERSVYFVRWLDEEVRNDPTFPVSCVHPLDEYRIFNTGRLSRIPEINVEFRSNDLLDLDRVYGSRIFRGPLRRIRPVGVGLPPGGSSVMAAISNSTP